MAAETVRRKYQVRATRVVTAVQAVPGPPVPDITVPACPVATARRLPAAVPAAAPAVTAASPLVVAMKPARLAVTPLAQRALRLEEDLRTTTTLTSQDGADAAGTPRRVDLMPRCRNARGQLKHINSEN